MKIVLKKKRGKSVEEPPKWVGADNIGKPAHYEHEQMKAKLEAADAWMVKWNFQSMYGEGVDTSNAPEWILRLALLYGACYISSQRRSAPLTETEYRRYKLARSLDVVGMKKETDTHTYMECNLRNLKGGSTMATKTRREDKKRVTASSVLVPLFSRDTVPTDDELITTVRKATGSIKFDGRQLAWYKSQYRQGELKGQEGKKAEINQPKPAKAPKAAKKAKTGKKVVLKAKKADK